MGTINFKTGDIFTLGLNLDEITEGDVAEWLGYSSVNAALSDYEYDEFEAIMQNEKDAYMQEVYEYCEDAINNLKISDAWFEVKLEYGYYESFELMVNKKYLTDKEIEKAMKESYGTPSFVWDLERLTKEDREEVRDELNIIRDFLKEMIKTYLHVCYPSWTGGWVDKHDIELQYIDEDIDEAIKDLGL